MVAKKFWLKTAWVCSILLSNPISVVASIVDVEKQDRISSNQSSVAHAPLNALPRLFEEGLIRTAPTTAREDESLRRALDAYLQVAAQADFSALEEFLADYPQTGWRLALQTNLGLQYYRTGYFSRAIAAWEDAWATGKNRREPLQRALADRAIGELIRMHARLGHADRLESLLKEIADRPLTGSATEMVAGAKQGLWSMQNEPEVAYLCGPMALRNVALLHSDHTNLQIKALEAYRSGPNGVTLAQVEKLAQDTQLPYRAAFREGGKTIPVPSIVHWKVNHYAAIIAERDGRYQIQDPTFGIDLWITKAALDAETSNYFLIPSQQQLAQGWRAVGDEEAEKVQGRGITNNSRSNQITPLDEKAKTCPPNHGMCGYNVHSMLVSLNLTDTPVGYQPPIGPAVFVTFTYNHRESFQPAVPNFSNLGPKWTSNWLSYITDDPAIAGASVQRYVAGGGAYDYAGFNSSTGAFTAQTDDFSVLVRVSAAPIRYERYLRDGSKEVYEASDGATTFPRRVFLSQVFDRKGQAVTLNYDSQLRLVSLTDATSRQTTFSYGLPANPLLITGITDPFGRSASIQYDGSGRLSQITDVQGLVSQFDYDGNFIDGMTTPYGATTFSYSESGTTRSVNITDPLGFTERVEYRHQAPGIPANDTAVPAGMVSSGAFVHARNTYYWDKHAYQLGAGDYTKAQVKHWFHWADNTNYTDGVLESTKEPLESRVWYNTPGSNYGISGTYEEPSKIGRVLDDGTTQLTQISYNSAGNPTVIIDPMGRETVYEYASNQIDLLRVKQKTAPSTYVTVAEFTYNTQHLPLTYTDEAGQTTTYTYNSAGQRLTSTNALSQETEYHYDSLGYLTEIIDANDVTVATFTYDSAGRMATRTDAANQTLSYQYDNLDRLTRITYPDTTYIQYQWDKLDVASITDRLGRTTTYTHDANRNLTAITDPANRVTSFTHYRNGALKSQTDAENGVAQWARDIQSRVTSVTDPIGTVTTYTYSNAGNKVIESNPASGSKIYVYNAAEDVIQKIDARDVANNYSYDVRGRPIGTAFPDDISENVTLTYDSVAGGNVGQGRLTGFSNDGGSTALVYDAVGNLAQRTDVIGTKTYVTGYQYDNLNRLHKVTYPSGHIVTYNRNALGQITEVLWQESSSTSTQTVVSDVTYRPWGPLNAMTFGNGVDTTIQHDANHRVTNITTTSTPQHNISYTYDTAGNITDLTDAAGTYTKEYGYDDVDRLVTDSNEIGLHAYAYDANGNRAQLTAPSGSGLPESQYTATYNKANRLSSYGVATGSSSLVVGSYLYNAIGQRTQKINGFAAHQYQYDQMGQLLAQTELDEVGSAGELREYIWLDNIPVAQLITTFSGGVVSGSRLTYIHADHLSTPRVMTDSTDAVVWQWEGDAFGAALPQMDPDGDSIYDRLDLRFPGQLYDAETGSYYNYFRNYYPGAGRYLQSDPLGISGGLNTYSYVMANPVSLIDPQGLKCRYTYNMGTLVQVCDGVGGDDGASHGSGDAAVFPATYNNARYSDCYKKCLDETAKLEGGTAVGGYVCGIAAAAANKIPEIGAVAGVLAGGGCKAVDIHLYCQNKCSEEERCAINEAKGRAL